MLGRPPTPVLIKTIDKRYNQISVSRSEELWVVTFKGEPIKTKRESQLHNGPANYCVEVYTSQYNADRRAGRYNTKFNSQDFGSRQLF